MTQTETIMRRIAETISHFANQEIHIKKVVQILKNRAHSERQ